MPDGRPTHTRPQTVLGRASACPLYPWLRVVGDGYDLNVEPIGVSDGLEVGDERAKSDVRILAGAVGRMECPGSDWRLLVGRSVGTTRCLVVTLWSSRCLSQLHRNGKEQHV